MAKIHTLTYNGTKSSDLGVFVSGSGSFDAAEFDVDKYEIPGRNGDLILSNNRYKNIEITYPAFIPKAFMDKVQNVRNWLRSSKVYARLEDTYDMDHYRLGIPTGVQSFSPENRNDGANFEMTFDCKPQRFLKVGETPETVEADVQTETGEIVTFETVAESPITSASVSLSPIQSGSGDPSPTNIRPISGHTGADLIRTGVNLLGVTVTDRVVSGIEITQLADGGIKVNGTAAGNVRVNIPATTYAPSKLYAGQPYTLSGSLGRPVSDAYIQLIYKDEVTGQVVSIVTTERPSTYTPTHDCLYNSTYINVINGKTFNNEVFYPMLNFGSYAAAYEPYQGDTYSVTFTDQGTVYGGTYDFVTGKLKVTHKTLTVDGTQALTWNSGAGVVQVLSTGFAATDDITQFYSDRFMAHSISGVADMNNEFAVNSAGILMIKAPALFTSLGEASTYFVNNPTQFVGLMSAPIEYTLSPQQLTTLLGANSVFGSGTITLTYAEPYNIDNPTLFDARPLFTVASPEEGDVIMVNGQAITFVDGYTGTVYIDCETMNAFSGAANLNSIIQATDFPVLVPGTNIVTWTGAGECTMTPRWWEL